VGIGFKLRTRMLGARLWPERVSPASDAIPLYGGSASVPAAKGWKRHLQALSTTLGAEQERWFPWWVVGFAGGIALYFGLSVEPSLLIVGVGTTVATIVGLAGRRSSNELLRFVCALIAACGLGFGAAKVRAERVDAPVIARDTGPVRLTGRIENVEIRGPNRARITLAPSTLEDSDAPPQRVRLTLIGARAVEAAVPGAHVNALAVLRPPPEPVLPYGYDFARWAYFQGIGGVGFTYGAPQPVADAPAPTLTERLQAAILSWRLAITKRVETAVPGPDGTISAALITGTRGAIPDEDTEAYRDSGLAHVLSISGLHLGLAGLGIFFIVRALLALSPRLALTQPIKKWAAVAAFLSASFYLLISGGGAPAVRSHLMLSAMLLGVLADRPALSMRAVAIAALLILAVTPEEIVNPGFQMSFAAVIGLIALAEWYASRPRSDEPAPGRVFAILRRSRRYLFGVLAASLVATLATTPIGIYHFDRAASYSLLANLLAEPIVAFVIMPAAAAAVVMMPFGLEAGPLQTMGWGVHQITAIAHWVADLPGATTLIRAWPLSALLGIVFGGLWIALWRRNWRWLGLAPIALSFAVIQFSERPDVFIARDGQSAAVRGEDGRLVILAARPDDYTTEQWLLRDGDRRGAVEARMAARCDELGCVAQAVGGRTVALSLRIGALAEDCARADVLIAALPVRRDCEGPEIVVDRFDVFRNGATTLSFGEDGIVVQTVNDARGARPWAVRGRSDQ
jgi:competence protein ComEC